MKRFNITTTCIKEKHYMVDISNKLEKITELIDNNMYFTINRARQYGKTTTLSRLFHVLNDRYIMLRGSLEDFGDEPYKTEQNFASAFIYMIKNVVKYQDKTLSETIGKIVDINSFQELSAKITDICMASQKEIVLMIDEVDKAGSNIIFLDFLAMLRDKYNKQKDGLGKTFKSVILAGVHDVKNLKMHIGERRVLTEAEARLFDKTIFNSPWNVAEDFNIDMSFNPSEILTMLEDYELDYKTGMNKKEISEEIYKYTSGYPVLVSRICKTIHENKYQWSTSGTEAAVKTMFKDNNILFDSVIKNIENDAELKDTIYSILIEGVELSYVKTDPIINKAEMYGIVKENENSKVQISNKIFEILLYNHMAAKKERETIKIKKYETTSQFITSNGDLDIIKVLEKFQELMKEEYRNETGEFVEREGRLIFLAFIKPIINGAGFYYVEPQTRTNKRMDIVVAYNKKEYIIELKKWYGKAGEDKGFKQLADYMNIKNSNESYMIVFNFRKRKRYIKEWKVIDGKRIFEVVV